MQVNKIENASGIWLKRSCVYNGDIVLNLRNGMKTLLNYTQKLLQNKRSKRILGIFVFFGLSGFVLQNSGIQQNNILEIPQVYAQTDNSASASAHAKLQDKAIMMNNILKVIYIILWPLITLAGVSLDNSLVYGSLFHLDVPLWKLWNIMKNFANFALGFLVLVEILKSIFTGFNKESAVGGPIKVIKNALIAGILIQASWFLTAAVIDISTIATYAVGGLPMSVFKDSNINGQDMGDMPILSIHSDMNFSQGVSSDGGMDIWYYYGNSKRISSCRTAKLFDETYIVGKNNGYYDINNLDNSYEKGLCVYFGNRVIKFVEFEDIFEGKNLVTETDYDNAITNRISTQNTDQTALTSYEQQGHFINTTSWREGFTDAETLGYEGGKERLSQQNGLTVSTIIDKSKGFSHALLTLYNSFLNFANMSDIDIGQKTAGGAWLEMFVKIIFALALVIPLVLIAIVLIARIAFLWLIIAFSPILVLIWLLMKDSKILGDIKDKIKFQDVLGIIFSPVITVFLLSLSVVFMSIIVDLNNTDQDKFFEKLGATANYDSDGNVTSYNIMKAVDWSANGNNTNNFGHAPDLLSWFIINLFAIGLIWTILLGAIKANKIGDKIMGNFNITERTKTALGSIPIIPVGGGKGVGIKTAKDTLFASANSYLGTVQSNQKQTFQDALKPTYNASGMTTTQHTNVASNFASNGYSLTRSIDDNRYSKFTNADQYSSYLRTSNNGYDNFTSKLSNANIAINDLNNYSPQDVEVLLNSGGIQGDPAAGQTLTVGGGQYTVVSFTNAHNKTIKRLFPSNQVSGSTDDVKNTIKTELKDSYIQAGKTTEDDWATYSQGDNFGINLGS